MSAIKKDSNGWVYETNHGTFRIVEDVRRIRLGEQIAGVQMPNHPWVGREFEIHQKFEPPESFRSWIVVLNQPDKIT